MKNPEEVDLRDQERAAEAAKAVPAKSEPKTHKMVRHGQEVVITYKDDAELQEILASLDKPVAPTTPAKKKNKTDK